MRRRPEREMKRRIRCGGIRLFLWTGALESGRIEHERPPANPCDVGWHRNPGPRRLMLGSPAVDEGSSSPTMPSSLYAARIRGLLDISRIVRDADDLPSKLARIADAIAESLRFGTVAIHLYRPAWDDFEVAAVHGSAATREALLGGAEGWEFWQPLLDTRWERGGAYLIPDGELPELPPSEDPDAWRSGDVLIVPLRAADGHVLGILAVDEPVSARRPTDEKLELLVGVAAHAAQAIEATQDAELSARYRRAQEQLLAVSSQLTGTGSVHSVLQAVCDAARDALGFELVAIALAARDVDRYLPAAAAGIDVAHADLQFDRPIASIDAIFDPRFEHEGCYLLQRDEGLELLGVAPTSYKSSRNGRGPRAWNRHWLVVPWHDEDGSVAGFIWADDPTDRLIPERTLLQGLRTLANQAATAIDAAGRFEALQSANELHSAMLAATPIGTICLGLDGRVLSWNDAARRMFGFADADVIGRTPPWIPTNQHSDFERRFRELVESGEVQEAVYSDQHRDGTSIRVRTTSAPVRDSAGAVTSVIAAIEDITELERGAADLARRNAELEALHTTTLDLLDRHDVDATLETIVADAGDLLAVDNGYLYLVDPDSDELVLTIGRGFFAEYEGTRLQRGNGLCGRVWETGEPLTVDDYGAWSGRAERFDGTGFDGSAAGVPLRSGTDVVGVLGVTSDEPGRTFGEAELTLLRRFGHLASLALNNARVYQDLRKSQELYRAIVESSTDVLTLIDLKGRVVYASPAHEAVTGYTLAEIQNTRSMSRIHPEDAEGVAGVVAESLAGGTPEPYVARFRHADGHWLTMEGITAIVRNESGKPEMLLAIARDVTDRLAQEAFLRKTQELYRTVVENSRDVILRFDLDGNVQYASPSQRALLGYSEEELVGANAFAIIVHPDDAQGVRESVANALSGGESRPYAARVRHRDGHWVDVEGLPAPIPGEDGRPAAILAVFRDITERTRIEESRRRALESLAREKEATERLIESANAMVVSLDRSGRISTFNAEAERVTGYSREEVAGRDWFDFLTPRERYPEVWEMFESSMLRGAMPEEFQNALLTKSGEERSVSWRNGLVYSEDGELQGLTAFGIDQTQRLNLEEQLRQAQKMEAIGQLAGGIAHDFNNLLTAITGYGDLALAKMADDDPVRRNIQEMCRAGERASVLTKQLLAYSRKQVLQPKVLRLNEVVEGMDGMLSRLLGEQVELSANLAGDLGYTRADPGQIEQVLMNLAINARDAMPEGGRLTITTANVELDEQFGRQHVGAEPGDYVMLAVSDTGVGMARETLDRVFDPFFTTKPAGQGTGLGLSTVYGIVTQTGGHIWPYSEPGRGTSFKVYLPRVWERVADREEHAALPSSGGTETVLLVEDEDIVRMLVHEMLENDGYSVLTASSGEAALELSRSYAGRIDVLMTDVVMPGLSGQQLAERLVAERPEVLVVFASGYTEDAIANHGVLRPGTAFLEKPFSARDLARTLRHVLDTTLAAA
jgi:two-component system cell cycle sensor histidine kinase/response regulator CckA